MSLPINNIYTCNNGTHIVCGKCYPKYGKNKCPICGDASKLAPNKFLDKILFTDCPNKGCTDKILYIDTEHEEQCICKMQKCFLCDTMLQIADIGYHLMDNHEWSYCQDFNINVSISKNVIETHIYKQKYSIILAKSEETCIKLAFISILSDKCTKKVYGTCKNNICVMAMDIPLTTNLNNILWVSFDKFYSKLYFCKNRYNCRNGTNDSESDVDSEWYPEYSDSEEDELEEEEDEEENELEVEDKEEEDEVEDKVEDDDIKEEEGEEYEHIYDVNSRVIDLKCPVREEDKDFM